MGIGGERKMTKRFGIRSQLIFYFVMVGLAISVTATFVGARILYLNLTNIQRSRLEDEATRLDKIVNQRTQDVHTKAKAISTDRDLIAQTEKRDYLNLYTKLSSLRAALELDVLEVVDTAGKLTYSTKNNQPSEDLPYDIAFRKALSGKIFQDVISIKDGVQIRAAVPLVKAGKVVGALLAGYALSKTFAQDFKNFSGLDVLFLYEIIVKSSTLPFGVKFFDARPIIEMKKFNDFKPRIFDVRVAGEQLKTGTKVKKFYNAVIRAVYYEPMDTRVGYVVAMVSKDEAQAAVRRAQKTMFGSCIVGLLVAVLSALVISQRFAKPVLHLAEVAASIAEGDLKKEVHIDRRDELGRLAGAFNRMTKNLRDIIDYQRDRIHKLLRVVESASKGDLTEHVSITSEDEFGQLGAGFNLMIENLAKLVQQINDAIKEVRAASGKIQETAHDQATGVTEQAAQISDLASSINELSATARQIAQNAEGMSRQAGEANQAAVSGGSAVDDSVASMLVINETVQGAGMKLKNLAGSYNKIVKTVGTIQEVTEKINLLALNASIEAARAGVHGRGFSVVATEVRRLAEKTSSFASEINKLLDSIKAETEGTIAAMEESTKSVEDGVTRINIAGKALKDIVRLVEQTSLLTKEISTSIEEQYRGNEQAAMAMGNLSQVVKQTERAAKETDLSARTLNELAEGLTRATQELKVKKE